MKKTRRFIAYSCVHMPYVDRDGEAWLFEQIGKFKPDLVVCLGDLMDADAASRWESEAEHALEREYVEASQHLETIAKMAPRADFVFCEGNHDFNLRAPCRFSKKVRSLLDYRRHIALSRWKWIPYVYNKRKGQYSIGQVRFFHGFSTGSTAAENRQATLMCEEYDLAVSGHTHRPQGLTQVALGTTPINTWRINPGTLMQLDPGPEYMRKQNDSAWGQGAVIGEASTGKSRSGCHWSAELLVNKMAWGCSTPWRKGL